MIAVIKYLIYVVYGLFQKLFQKIDELPLKIYLQYICFAATVISSGTGQMENIRDFFVFICLLFCMFFCVYCWKRNKSIANELANLASALGFLTGLFLISDNMPNITKIIIVASMIFILLGFKKVYHLFKAQFPKGLNEKVGNCLFVS